MESLILRVSCKWRVCGYGLNRFVHEGMNHISNVEVHLKTRNGNVNIETWSILEILLQASLFESHMLTQWC